MKGLGPSRNSGTSTPPHITCRMPSFVFVWWVRVIISPVFGTQVAPMSYTTREP